MKKATKALKRSLSLVLAFLLVFSSGLVSFAETAGEEETSSIDYTFDASSKQWGCEFGNYMDSYSRWQSFTMPEDGNLNSAEVWLIKKPNTDGAVNDLSASVYEMQEGLPSVRIGEAVIVKGEDVVDKGVTTIDLSAIGKLSAGKQYALLLTATPCADDWKPAYDWVSTPQTEATKGEIAGKENGNGLAAEEIVGIMYLKVNYQKVQPKVIDQSFDTSKVTWGYGFGSPLDAEWRYQSFTMPEDGDVTAVEVFLIKQYNVNDPENPVGPNDLVAAIYEMSGDVPSKQISETVTIPVEDIGEKGELKISLPVTGLRADTRYAVCLTQTPVTHYGQYGEKEVYDWPGSLTTDAHQNEVNGKFKDGWVKEGGLGEGIASEWLKVYYVPGEAGEDPDPPLPPAPEGAVPYDIRLTASNPDSLAIGETTEITALILDQTGAYIEDAEVTFESNSDVVSVSSSEKTATVTAAKEGVATITAKSENAVAKIDVYVYDSSKDYTVPTPGMVITEDTVLRPGVYNFGGASNGIVIGANDINVVGDHVKIVNVAEDKILADVTTGAYAYQLNPVPGQSNYNMARELVLSDAASIQISFDAKAKHFIGTFKVQTSEDGISWSDDLTLTTLGGWQKYTVDLSKYSGKTVSVRLRYETESQVPEDMLLLLDTIELFEDGVRTFSDLCEAKPFYYWDISYGDGTDKVSDSLKSKPFDRTAYNIATSLYKGTGVLMDGISGASVTGLTVSGFYWGVKLSDCDAVTVENCVLSNNFTDPISGWGDQDGGGLLMENVTGSIIQNNLANNNANALIMRKSDHNTINGNSFAIASDVCLEMNHSSYNTVENNDFSWGIRIDAYDEVHARDSTSSLFESGSNYNYIYRNDFTHGGDGIFLRPLDGFACEGNVFEENDASYANNNAVESWAGRNYYIRNKANWSSYGFWMGGSDESEMNYNEIAYNGICPHNAPEAFGNAGISIVQSNPSSNMKIVGNDIHDNYGPGIALTHTQSWPAYHYLIQNNRIVNNVTSPYNRNHVGYAIWLDQVEWMDISGNLMEGNASDTIRTSAGSKLVTERNGVYLDSQAAYEAQAPVAAISADKSVYYVGEEITFSGADSIDPNGDALTFRWDMGDGTFALGETVKHTFTDPGYYSVAFTVTDGTWSDIIWLNVNVVQPGAEIGTDKDASQWTFTSNDGKTTLETQKPAEGKQRDDIPYYTYYTVDGASSIKLHSTAGSNTITYPASKDAALDLSGDNALNFSMKVQNAAYEGDNSHYSPTVRLYTDADNYVQFDATTTLLAPFYYKTIFSQMQLRQEWVNVTIPYQGGAMWKKSVVGTPDMSNINYISINTETYANDFTFYLDGMKSVSVEETKMNKYVQNIASDATAIYSTASDASNSQAPLSGSLSTAARWESMDGDEDIWYGADFGASRYLDRVDFYLYYEPVGNPSLDTIVLPDSAVVEYYADGEWKNVKNVEMETIRPNGNTIAFDLVEASKVRVKFKTAENAPVSLYGFQVFNTENQMAELNYEGKPVPTVTSTVVSDVLLDTVEIWGNVNDTSLWDSDIHDLQVYIYETDASGKGPLGDYLAKGLIAKKDVNPSELPKLFKVAMRDKDGQQITLKAGVKYALLLATERDYDNNDQAHWRFCAGKNVSAAAGETFGKVTGQNNNYDTIYGFSVENLGTGWLRIYAQGSDTPVVDYSFETNGKSGYGVGAWTEDSRYQTFTVPKASITSVMNGLVNDDWTWSDPNEEGSIFVSFDEEKEIKNINIAFAEGGIPATMVIKNGEQEIVSLTADDLKAGFNLITLEESIHAAALTFTFTNGETPAMISEIETMGDVIASEEAPVDKSLLGESIAAALVAKEHYLPNLIESIKQRFEAALAHAQEVYDDETGKYTQADVDQADDQLILMMQYLSFTADIEGLDTAIQHAKSVIESGKYQDDEMMAIYKEAYQAAVDLMADKDTITDTEITPVIAALEAAEKNLNEVVIEELYLKQLQHEVSVSEGYKLDAYIADAARDIFEAALTTAQDILNKALAGDSSITQKMVDDAAAALHTARLALRLIPNKDALNALLNKAQAIDLNQYTEQSAEVLKAAVKAARAVYADPMADQDAVDQAQKVLAAAIDGLQRKSDNGGNSSSQPNGNGSSNNGNQGSQTGDNGNFIALFALLIASMTAAAVVVKRRKESRD